MMSFYPHRYLAFVVTAALVMARINCYALNPIIQTIYTADHSTIRPDRNDLSYVTVEVVDPRGIVIPTAAIPIRFTVTGAGELASTGSPAPNDASSFHLPLRKTFEGRCLVILRPKGDAGKITLKADADGVKSATVIAATR
jgi:beta-galactosidase